MAKIAAVYLLSAFNPIDTESDAIQGDTSIFLLKRLFLENGGIIFDPALYGLKSRLDATLGPMYLDRLGNFHQF